MLDTTDKKALWMEIIEMVELAVPYPLLISLREQCYLDKAEGGLAVIVTESDWMCTYVKRKAGFPLKQAFSEKFGRNMQLKIVERPPRVYENPQTLPLESNERAILMEKYGDIMAIVRQHPVFVRVCKRTEQGGWGIFPQLLTVYSKAFGPEVVLKGLRAANQPNVRNPRGFFFHTINTGQYGSLLPGGKELLDELSTEFRKEKMA